MFHSFYLLINIFLIVADSPSVPETTSLLGIKPRYHLRSRYAGLLSNDENAEIDIQEVSIPIHLFLQL